MARGREVSIHIALMLMAALAAAGEPPQVATPQAILTLRWGQGHDQVGGGVRASGIGEGVPASFLVDARHTYVLDTVNQRVLVFDKGAKTSRVIELVGPGLMEKGDVAVDLAVGKDGDLYVADGKHQDILHVGPDGKGLGRFGHFQEIGRLEWAPEGLAVRDQGALKVVVFSPEGRVVREVAHADVEPVWTDGHFVMGRQVLNRVYSVGAMDKDGPVALAKLDAHAGSKGGGVLGGTILGTDARGQIYVQVVEGSGATISGEWIYRLDAGGKVTGQVRVEPYQGRFLTLRRVYRVTPEGDVVRLATGPDGYRLLRWTVEGL